MSFGTVALVNHLPGHLKTLVLNTFQRYEDVCFIVKWDGERPTNLTGNVLTYEWMPQQDILAHPKIRAFITHGGLLGIQEAVYFGVPLIVMPFFAEQDYNAEKIAREGYGIRLEVTKLEQNQFDFAIRDILNNPK